MTSPWRPWGGGRWIVVVVLGLPLLWLSIAVTIAGIASVHRPAQALAWWPWSAEAAANLGAQRASSTSVRDRREAAALARRALARQAILPVAIRTLAVTTVYANPTSDQPRRLIGYGETLSRRDAATQLWLIEDNVQRGNVAAALVHYDRVLRTSIETRTQLLPVLTTAVNDTNIARPLAALLARGPSWRDDFISQVVTHVDNPLSLAMLLPQAGLSPRSPQDRNLLQQGLTRIATQGRPDTAYRLYRNMGGRPPASGQALINGDLTHEPGLAPFDWTGNDDPALTTGREMGEGGWRLHASVAAGAAGVLARQLIILSPGRYTVDAAVSGPRSDGSILTLTLRCLDGAKLFSAAFEGRNHLGGMVQVPPGCHAAWFAFEGRGALDNGPSDYWIGPVSVRRTDPGLQ